MQKEEEHLCQHSDAASKVCYGDARMHAGKQSFAIKVSTQVHWPAPKVLHTLA